MNSSTPPKRPAHSKPALVCIAAFMPDAGEVLGELSGRFPGSELEAGPGPRTRSRARNGQPGLDLYIRTDRFHDVFAQDVPRSTPVSLPPGNAR